MILNFIGQPLKPNPTEVVGSIGNSLTDSIIKIKIKILADRSIFFPSYLGA